ncbi:MAG TPA: hypothetical protein VGG75_38195 [Trebonia sp.]|jgi:hypothetical protein
MSSREPDDDARVPWDDLRVLTLDALHRYVAVLGLKPGDVLYPAILDRLEREDELARDADDE